MSTPAVQIPISAVDLTSPAFAAAENRAREFQNSIESTTGSFKEARGAAMLFGEEVGTHMNRHLVTVLASSQLLQGIASLTPNVYGWVA